MDTTVLTANVLNAPRAMFTKRKNNGALDLTLVPPIKYYLMEYVFANQDWSLFKISAKDAQSIKLTMLSMMPADAVLDILLSMETVS